MRALIGRSIGLIVIVAALVGLAVAIGGLILVPRVERQIRMSVLESLAISRESLEATAGALEVVESSLDDTRATLDSIEAVTLGVAQTVSDTVPLIDAMATVTGRDIPNSLFAAQLSMVAAAEGARTVEQMLLRLNSLAYITGVTYNPRMPLQLSLRQVATSLEPLPASFVTMGSSLGMASGNVQALEGNISSVATTIAEIDTTIDEAKSVAGQYRQVVEELQSTVTMLEANATSGLRWLGLGVRILLLWLAVSQLGALGQGWEMLTRSGRE